MKKSRIMHLILTGVLASAFVALPTFAEVSRSGAIDLRKGVQAASVPKEALKVDAKVKRPVRSLITQNVMQKIEQEAVALGQKTKLYEGVVVAKVTFSGMQQVAADDLKDKVKQVPGSKVTVSGMEEDLKALYDTGWFYEVTPVFKTVPEGVQINYVMLENPLFVQLDVEGNTKMSTDKIRKTMGMVPGKVINARSIAEGIRKVESVYSKDGFILARVNDIRLLDNGHLVLAVNEGLVEGFKVKGNTKTKDYVIIREMKLKKGKPFNAKDARRSMQKIYNLGYFEDVNVKLMPGQTPNGVVVEASVVERSTGSFSIGFGYSDADGFLGMFNIGDKNLRGTGDKVNFRWEFGRDSNINRNWQIDYTHPWLDRHGTSVGVSLYNMTNEYIDYNRDAQEIARYYKKRAGQEVVFSRPTNDDRVINHVVLRNRNDTYVKPVDGYGTQYYEGKDIDGTYHPEQIQSRLDENFGLTRSIGFERTFDSRDNIYDPREGKRNSYSLEVASFGGDFSYQKLSVDYRYYYKAGKNCVWAWDIAAGYAHGDMPLSQRFAVGGSDTLRGYEDNQFRGNSMLRTSMEFRFPIVKKVQGVFFTDAGYAWSKKYDEKDFDLKDMKYSIGIGIRVNSPLGPLRLDYGIPLKNRDKQSNRFHFSFGGQF